MRRSQRHVLFSHTGDPRFPYEAEVDGERWRVRLNEFPEEETLYTLLVDGEPVEHPSDWPAAWFRPPLPPRVP